MKILITAFDPFGGEKTNASLEVLKRIDAPAGVELCKLQLPTVFRRAGELLLKEIRKTGPDAVICLGQAAGRSAVTPERAALNIRDASIPDNEGNQPVDEAVIPGGPTAYFSPLPLREMVNAALSAGIPSSVSNSAGTFVCNDVMYTLLHAAANEFPGLLGGFIHVPACSFSEKTAEISILPAEKAVEAIKAMLAVLR